MTFDLQTIAIFCAGAVIYSAVLPRIWRKWALLIASVVAVYWLQPALPNIRYSDYLLPTFTIIAAVIGWWWTRPQNDEAPHPTRDDWITLGVILALVLGMAGMRYIDADYRLTAGRPPDPLRVVIFLAIIAGITLVVERITRLQKRLSLPALGILLVIGIFVVLKAEPLVEAVAAFFRERTGRDPDLASAADLNWLGFSYVAFRLIHTLRDRQTGKLPDLSLREYVTYIIFFPAFISGPIDRAERFIKDFRALPEMVGLDANRFTVGTGRITVGLFKKFVIADTLALGMALNATNAEQATSAGGMWFLLYGYALRLFFDFSGYSDIAIGIGILLGIKLPENFDRPYLKTNITAFWQSWHMTLSNWARFYVFTPFSRFLLTRKPKPSSTVIVLLAQAATMITIGLWHGITLNFIVWGLWHGVGLFLHKQWSDRTRKWYRGLNDKPWQKRTWSVVGWFITLQFVVIGWVWFTLPDLDASLHVLRGLMGLGF